MMIITQASMWRKQLSPFQKSLALVDFKTFTQVNM